MVATINTIAFDGINARTVEVQVQVANGMPAFSVVGLPDKAVTEARERVRAALSSISLTLPPGRITVNLSPADLPKEGSHYDLPIALGIMVATGALEAGDIGGRIVIGELGLDSSIRPVAGAIVAAMHAVGEDLGLICPQGSGSEAAWASDSLEIIAAPNLMAIVNHLKGMQTLPPPEAAAFEEAVIAGDLRDIKGQESAKRALEVAAAGGHNLMRL